MAIDFPDSPSVNDLFTVDNKVWIWTGSKWDSYPTTSPGVPSGGTTGQVLVKNSGTDYDTAWVTASNSQLLVGTGTDFTDTQTISLSEGVYRATSLSGYSDVLIDGENVSGTPFIVESSDSLDVSLKKFPDNFTKLATPTYPIYYSVAYGNGMYVAGAYSQNAGVYGVQTSTDLVTWTFRPIGSLTNWTSGVAFNGSVFVVTTVNGKVAVSSDGITWSTYTFPQSFAYRIVAVGGVFTVASSTDTVYTSSNGTTWTNVSITGAGTAQLTGFFYINNKYVMLTSSGPALSSDGVNYTLLSNNGFSAYSAAYGNGVWVFGGTSGAMYKSTDETTTTLIGRLYDYSREDNLGTTYNVQYLDGYFYANAYTNDISYAVLLNSDATDYSFRRGAAGYALSSSVIGSSVITFGTDVMSSNGVLPPSSSKALLEYIPTT